MQDTCPKFASPATPQRPPPRTVRQSYDERIRYIPEGVRIVSYQGKPATTSPGGTVCGAFKFFKPSKLEQHAAKQLDHRLDEKNTPERFAPICESPGGFSPDRAALPTAPPGVIRDDFDRQMLQALYTKAIDEGEPQAILDIIGASGSVAEATKVMAKFRSRANAEAAAQAAADATSGQHRTASPRFAPQSRPPRVDPQLDFAARDVDAALCAASRVIDAFLGVVAPNQGMGDGEFQMRFEMFSAMQQKVAGLQQKFDVAATQFQNRSSAVSQPPCAAPPYGIERLPSPKPQLPRIEKLPSPRPQLSQEPAAPCMDPERAELLRKTREIEEEIKKMEEERNKPKPPPPKEKPTRAGGVLRKPSGIKRPGASTLRTAASVAPCASASTQPNFMKPTGRVAQQTQEAQQRRQSALGAMKRPPGGAASRIKPPAAGSQACLAQKPQASGGASARRESVRRIPPPSAATGRAAGTCAPPAARTGAVRKVPAPTAGRNPGACAARRGVVPKR